MTWNEQVVRDIEAKYGQRVQAAGYHLVTRVRENISIPSRTVRYAQARSGKVKKVLGARGSNRSRPNDWVHKDFGTLRQSMAQQYDPATRTSRVGTASKVGRWIELGTRFMAPRKMLRATLAEERENIRRMIEHGEGL